MNKENQRQLDELFLKRALELSVLGPDLKMGHPFGCVVVKDDRIVGEGYNQVTSTNDPSAHAEVMAIRDACRNMKTPQLLECTIYTSCEPCPMCLGAIYWANAKRVVFANPKEALAKIEFEDQFVYDEIAKNMKERMISFDHIQMPNASQAFDKWAQNKAKTSN